MLIVLTVLLLVSVAVLVLVVMIVLALLLLVSVVVLVLPCPLTFQSIPGHSTGCMLAPSGQSLLLSSMVHLSQCYNSFL